MQGGSRKWEHGADERGERLNRARSSHSQVLKHYLVTSCWIRCAYPVWDGWLVSHWKQYWWKICMTLNPAGQLLSSRTLLQPSVRLVQGEAVIVWGKVLNMPSCVWIEVYIYGYPQVAFPSIYFSGFFFFFPITKQMRSFEDTGRWLCCSNWRESGEVWNSKIPQSISCI